MKVAAVSKGESLRRGSTALKLHRVAQLGEVSTAEPSPQASELQQDRPVGTGFALNTSLGVPRPFEGLRASRRGGARNRADRVSHNLTPSQVEGLIAAMRTAGEIGLPLNRMTTIHWERAGVPLAGMVRATGRYIDAVTRWLARKGHRTAWLYVHENGAHKGGHCHLVLHVPPELVKPLTGKQKAILKRIIGKASPGRSVKSDPIGGRLGVERTAPALHMANLAAVLHYVVKGADNEAASMLGLYRQDGGGPVIGKRCGTSQNIGAKARGEAMQRERVGQ